MLEVSKFDAFVHLSIYHSCQWHCICNLDVQNHNKRILEQKKAVLIQQTMNTKQSPGRWSSIHGRWLRRWFTPVTSRLDQRGKCIKRREGIRGWRTFDGSTRIIGYGCCCWWWGLIILVGILLRWSRERGFTGRDNWIGIVTLKTGKRAEKKSRIDHPEWNTRCISLLVLIE